MKKNTKYYLILIVALLVATTLMIVGCSGKALDTPEIRYNLSKDGIGSINWDSVIDAKAYQVNYTTSDGEEHATQVTEPTFRLPHRGRYKVNVVALAGDSKKLKDSAPSNTLDVLYAWQLAKPDVEFSNYTNGRVKYYIKNFDAFADGDGFDINIAGFSKRVYEDRGILDASLSEGKYTASIKAIGDNNISLDSEEVKTEIEIKPVKMVDVEYKTQESLNNLSVNIGASTQDIVKIEADLYEVDSSSYTFNKTTGELVVNENIILDHVGSDVQLIDVYFKDGNHVNIRVKIVDMREAYFGYNDYVTVREGAPANISFNIYNNKLENIELVKVDDTQVPLTLDKDYNLTVNRLSAHVKVFAPKSSEDKALIFHFKRVVDGATYTKRINYSFREEVPNLNVTHLTFNKADTRKNDLSFTYDPSIKADKIEIDYKAKQGADYTWEPTTGTITLRDEYLRKFDEGTVIVGKVYFGNDYASFTAHIIDHGAVNIAKFNDTFVNYDATSSANLSIPYVGKMAVSAVSLDGIRLNSESFLVKDKEVVLYPVLLDTLDIGVHELRVHVQGLVSYDVVATINVTINPEKMVPSRINVSINNTYPDIAFTYRNVGDNVSTILTNLRTGKTYTNIEGEDRVLAPYAEFNDGDKYTITHKASNHQKTSQEMTYRATDVESFEKYYNAKFSYNGDMYDAVIADNKEFEVFVNYALMYISKAKNYNIRVAAPGDTMLWRKLDRIAVNELPKEKGVYYEYQVRIYTPYIAFNNSNDYKDKIQRLFIKYADLYKEPTKVEVNAIRVEEAQVPACDIKIKLWSTNEPYAKDIEGHPQVVTRYNMTYEPQYKADGANRRPANYVFPIEKWEKSAPAYISDELFYLIEDGIRPEPIEGSPAEKMYNHIKGILREIIDDTMSEHQKYMAIFEWIIYNVTYDDETARYEKTLGKDYYKIYPRRCFYLDGVFYDKLAVCNGLGKAITVMAGIEGIHSVRVVGYSEKQRHAWNKVNLDGIWYNSDPTWGSIDLRDYFAKNDMGKTAEGINHLHTLVSDAPFKEKHSPDSRYNNMVGNINYNYFANRYVSKDDSAIHNMVIKNVEDINALVNYIKSNIVNADGNIADEYVAFAYVDKMNNGVTSAILNKLVEATSYNFSEVIPLKTLKLGRYGRNYEMVVLKRGNKIA